MTTEEMVQHYMEKPYTYELRPDPDGGWFVRVRELPGCISQGDTPEEALTMIRDAMAGWIEVALAENVAIPEPRALDSYSGKFVVRVPRSLHRDLVDHAMEERVSLNQFINVVLARAIGQGHEDSKDASCGVEDL